MTRQRLTWADRKASPAPALPTEAGDHPATYQDPGPHDYENGDTSGWKEDPTPPPYPHSGPPALPTEKGDHPATDPAIAAQVGKQAKIQMRAAMEQKAAKCIRLAQAMLGKNAAVDAIEDQALDLMHLTERQIQAALARQANYTLSEGEGKKAEEDPAEDEKAAGADVKGEDAPKAEEKKAGEDADEADEAEEETAGQKAARYVKLATYWIGIAKKAGEVPPAFKAQWGKDDEPKADAKKDDAKEEKKASDDEDEDEALLASMLEEEASKKAGESTDDDEALLASMLAEDTKKAGEDEAKEEPAKEEPADESKKEAAFDDELLSDLLVDDSTNDFALTEDPMGFMDGFAGPDTLSDEEMSTLYGSHFASGKNAGEDEAQAKEEPAAKAEDETKKEAAARLASAKRTAAQHPKPRTASTGVRALGGTPTRTASNEVADLSKLWETAPDVSKIFG